jgi:hypothetical protein
MTYTFVFRIRQVYFDQVVQGKKTTEYRKKSRFWMSRIAKIANKSGVFESPSRIVFPKEHPLGLFLCHHATHRREILEIRSINTPANFSVQGKQDVNTLTCFAFVLGDVIQ